MGWQEGATFGTAALYPSAGPVGLGPSVTVNVPPADVISIPNFLNPATGLFGLVGTTVSYYNSYEISLFMGNGAGTLGIALVTVFWFAQATDANPVYESSWYCQANGSGVLTVGSGPQRGNIMAITVQNLDVVSVTTVNLEVTGSQRAISNDNWQSNGVQVTQTATNARPFTNELLVITGASIAGSGASQTRGAFLYAGKSHLHITNTAAAGTFTGVLQDCVFTQAVIWSGAIPQGNPVEVDLILPHLPLQLIVTNSGAAAGTLTASLIADRV